MSGAQAWTEPGASSRDDGPIELFIMVDGYYITMKCDSPRMELVRSEEKRPLVVVTPEQLRGPSLLLPALSACLSALQEARS
jgi:hypothetical protein